MHGQICVSRWPKHLGVRKLAKTQGSSSTQGSLMLPPSVIWEWWIFRIWLGLPYGTERSRAVGVAFLHQKEQPGCPLPMAAKRPRWNSTFALGSYRGLGHRFDDIGMRSSSRSCIIWLCWSHNSWLHRAKIRLWTSSTVFAQKNNFESFLEGVDELFPGFLLANCFDNRDTLLLVNKRRRILWTPLRNKAGFTVKAFINVNMSK